jgi:Metallo-peptidase family M12
MNSSMPPRHFNPVNKIQTLFAVVFAIIFLTAQIAGAEGNSDAPGLTKAPGLFMSPNASAAQGNKGALNKVARKMNKAAMRHRSVQVDKDVLKNKRLRLNLFDGSDFDAERTHVKEGIEGDMTWSGKLVGPVEGVAHITVRGNAAAGSITTEDGQLFEINTAADGGITIEEIDLDQLPPHVNPVAPPEGEPFEEDLSGGPGIENAPPTSADNGSTIDLMVVYTQATKNSYGVDGIEARITNAVAAMNSANANSLISSRFRLVHMAQVNLPETSDMGDALDRITSKTDGHADNVHALRDQYGADIVSLINENNNYGGIAWVMQSPGNWMERNAFNVVSSSSLSSHTLTHEIGHNEGCAHDRANAGVAGSYAYSYGHQDTVTVFRTIMSYNCPGGCSRIPNFSNPNVNYNGAPTGIDHNVDPNNSTDNVRTINNNELIIANWRQSVVASTPALEVIKAKAKLKPDLNDDLFKVKGIFTLDPGSDGIDPVTESFDLTLGTFSETINPGSFVRKKKGWIYKAPKAKPFSGIKKISLKDNGKFAIVMKGVELSGIDFSNPVLFSTQINNDQAEFMIPFDNTKPTVKSYKRPK